MDPGKEICSRCGGVLNNGFCPHCVAAICLPLGDHLPAPTLEGFSGYEILSEIGRGGMGIVYRASDPTLRREVALKVLLAGRFADARLQQRFRREAEAVASLSHPGIVRIFEFGEEDGMPWFSMELIHGTSLSEAVRNRPMLPNRAAGVALRIAEALAHAHAQGVVHRDLKPANVLLDAVDAPHLVDFGIAKLVRDSASDTFSSMTLTGATLGSPGFIAPEQAFPKASKDQTGPAADVYGLGAILYFLLTARPPHQAPSLEALLLAIRDDDPLAPHQFANGVPRDLEAICLQCLRKEPDRRYASANALAADLRRYLDGDPVHARPPSTLTLLRSWIRRHPVHAVMIAAAITVTALVIAGSLRLAKVHGDLERRANLIATASGLLSQRVGAWRTKAMAALDEASRIQPSDQIRNIATASLALPQIEPLGTGQVKTTVVPPDSMSRDGSQFARVTGEHIEVIERASGDVVTLVDCPSTNISLLKLDDRASRIAIAIKTQVNLCSLPDGKHEITLTHPQPVLSVDWAGELIACACADRFVYIWNDDGTLRHRLAGHEGDLPFARFRDRGQELITMANDKWLRVWHAARGDEITRLQAQEEHCLPLWFEQDGKTLHSGVVGGGEARFRIDWSPSLEVLAPPAPEPHPESVGTLALHPDGDLVATVDEKECRLRSFRDGRLLATIAKGPAEWMHVRFSPSGDRFWACGWDNGMVSIPIERDVKGAVSLGSITAPRYGAGHLLYDISTNGRLALLANTSDSDPHVSVVSLDSETEIILPQAKCLTAAFSNDQRFVITSGYDKPGATVWSIPEGSEIHRIPTRALVTAILFSPDGKWLLLATENGNFRMPVDQFDALQEIPNAGRLNASVWSPRGNVIASLDGKTIMLLDALTLAERNRLILPEYLGWVGNARLAFDSTGRYLAVHTALGTVARWDLDSLR